MTGCPTRRGAVALLLTVLLAAVLAGPALAQDEDALQVSVRDSTFYPDGATELVVNVIGSAKPEVVAAEAFHVTENGEDVGDLEVTPLLETDDVEVATALLIDISSSMAGEPLDAIKEAASDLVVTLTEQDIAVALIAFESHPHVLAGPTTDTDTLLADIDGLDAFGRTALYDAVANGIMLLEDVDGVRDVVVLADGEDNESTRTLDEAIDAAVDAGVPVTVIAFETELFEPEVLEPLATETDGRMITTTDVAEFADIFELVAEDVASQYTLAYSSSLEEPSELDLTVAVELDDATAETAFTVLNPRDSGTVDQLRIRESFDAGWLGTTGALYTSIGLAFLALVLFLGVLLVPQGDRTASRALRRGLNMVQRGERQPTGPASGMAASSLGQRAVDLVERVPRPSGYDERLQTDLDRAGWQLRSTEFTAMRVGTALVGLLGVWALTATWWLGVVGLVSGVFLPVLFLSNSKQRRQARFMEQLPQTLQLLSGTLRAGYGLLQGIDTIVKETEDPMSSEFQRVLTEARLGLPLEDSLESMAERIESPDFRWVVVAMNIQRQVGGNLAALLETVSETLRGREQVQRQIKVLSAEGKLSATILIALPFVILAYMLVVNPTYLLTLFTHAFGLFMVGAAGLLMVVGVFWIRRMIRIDI